VTTGLRCRRATMNLLCLVGSREGRRCGRWLPVVLVYAGLLCGGPASAADEGAETASDVATRALLDQLEERQMSDVALWVLERVEKDGGVSASLKKEVPFRRATALVGTSRTETDSKKRAAIFDAADKEIDSFLKESPSGAQAINAYTQKGNLLIQRGRAKVEQAKAPGQNAKELLGEAVVFFDSAIKALQGTVKPNEEIKDVKNAEDAVIQALRAVNVELKAVKGDKPADEGAKGKKKPERRTAATEQRLEQLEEQQEELQKKLVQTRLMVAGAHFEKASALPPDSKEWQAAIKLSADKFKEIADKYPNTGGGLFARFYEGRNYAALKDWKKAADTVEPICALDAKVGFVPALRAKALNVAIQAWMAEKKYDRLDENLLKFALVPVPENRLDADWLGMKYRSAALLDALAAALPPNEKGKKGLAQRDAQKLALEVAKANKDFAKEARELLAKLGKDLPEGMADAENNFSARMDAARVAIAAMQEKQAKAKQLSGAEAEAAVAEAGKDRDKAAAEILAALKLVGEEDEPAAINNARYILTFLMYDAKRFHDSAALGTFLAEKYPNAKGSRQAAKIALASWQSLLKQSDPIWVQGAKEKSAGVAEILFRTWPTEPDSADAAVILIAAATESRDAARIVRIVAEVPKESPRRAEVLERAGAALWREVQESRRLEESVRPDGATIDGWKSSARDALDEGLAAAANGPPSKVAVAAALARAQLALEDGELAKAGELLEHKAYGPWTLAMGQNAEFAEGPLAEGALTVALRYFILSEKFDEAPKAMDALEKLAGKGEEASAKLTNMYLSMGRDLQSQLESLGAGGKGVTDEARQKAAKILGGFEKFLARVAERDEKVSSQMWVATTYLTLGSGGGSAAVVPKEKAGEYLDEAAKVYGKLLKKGDAEIKKFEPSIRLKMANIFKEAGKWEQAQEQLDWILKDPKRQSSLETQVQAAELLQAAGQAAAAAGDAKADTLLREAVIGRQAGGVWGWGGIAKKLAKQVGTGGRADELFFQARWNVCKCLADRAVLKDKSKEKKDEELAKAKDALLITRKLFPELGGDASRKRFEALYKDIQKKQGVASPGSFQDLDRQERAAEKATASVP
jgi:hypothetical protein